jgi:hypothetical protein
VTLAKFYKLFEAKLREVNSARPFLESIHSPRLRINRTVALLNRCECPLEFVSGVSWSGAGRALGLSERDANIIIGAADGSAKGPLYAKARKRLIKLCGLKDAA